MSSGGPPPLPLDTLAIVSTVLEAFLYGFSALMFMVTVWVLKWGREPSKASTTLVVISAFFLIFSGAHLIIDVVRIWQAFVSERTTYPGGTFGLLGDISNWSFVWKNVVYMLQTMLGDAIVIWRCYVVWQSYYIIIFPIIMWLSVGATGCGSVITLATGAGSNVFATTATSWIKSYYAATLATNLIATMLLAYKIWSVERATRQPRHPSMRSGLKPVLDVVIDAGILYSATMLTALICFTTGSPGNFIVLDMITPIISIAFYMVIIRVAIASGHTPLNKSVPGHAGVSTFNRSGNHDGTFSMDRRVPPVDIHISKSTHRNEDWDSDNLKPGAYAV